MSKINLMSPATLEAVTHLARYADQLINGPQPLETLKATLAQCRFTSTKKLVGIEGVDLISGAAQLRIEYTYRSMEDGCERRAVFWLSYESGNYAGYAA